MKYIKEFHTEKDMEKIETARTKNKKKCKCGHIVVMASADRMMCNWCGSWIYRTPEIEFRYKLMKKLKENK